MAQVLSLGAALTSATSNTSVKGEDANVAFQRGGTVIAVIQPTNGAFVGTAKVQGTNDLDSVADGSATWTDLLSFVAPASQSGSKMAAVTAYRRMRINCTVFTSGSVEGLLIA
jgi:hypothetical protein